MSSGSSRREFLDVIRGTLELIERHGGSAGRAAEPPALVPAEPLPSLLDQCRTLLREAAAQAPPPLRLVHHLACSGGTVIARCIAALPNVRLLSEVDPLSDHGHMGEKFFPSDLIGLAKFGSRPPDRAVLLEIFRTGLTALYEDSRRSGLDLVLRDHAHSHFCHGDAPEERPSLREILTGSYPLRGVVTLRHPLDSFLGLANNGWLHFAPATVAEYARRYHAFLDRHADLPWLRYEDFLQDPETEMQRICTALDLVYDPAFRQLFPTLQLSGDSGRAGVSLAPRPRRACPEALLDEVRTSTPFTALIDRMGYDLP